MEGAETVVEGALEGTTGDVVAARLDVRVQASDQVLRLAHGDEATVVTDAGRVRLRLTEAALEGEPFEARGTWGEVSKLLGAAAAALEIAPHVRVTVQGEILRASQRVVARGRGDSGTYRDGRPSAVIVTDVRLRRTPGIRRPAFSILVPSAAAACLGLASMAAFAATGGALRVLSVGWLVWAGALASVAARRALGFPHAGRSPLQMCWLPQPQRVGAREDRQSDHVRGGAAGFVAIMASAVHVVLLLASYETVLAGEYAVMHVVVVLPCFAVAVALGWRDWRATRDAAATARAFLRSTAYRRQRGTAVAGAVRRDVRVELVTEGLGRGRVSLDRAHERLEASPSLRLDSGSEVSLDGATWLSMKVRVEEDGEGGRHVVERLEPGDAVQVAHTHEAPEARGPDTLIVASGAAGRDLSGVLARGLRLRAVGLVGAALGVVALALSVWLSPG